MFSRVLSTNLARPVLSGRSILQTQVRCGHFFTVETTQFWKYVSVFVGTGFCIMAFENAERRLNPYEERDEWRPWENFRAGRNTKFPFRNDEHGDRCLFYNPVVNPNPHTGYEDGDNQRRLFQAPSGYLHDPKVKATPCASSLEANIWDSEWRAEHGISDEEFEWMYTNKFAVKYTKDGQWRQPPHGH